MKLLFYIAVASFLMLLQGCSNSARSTTQVASNLINRQHVILTTQHVYPEKSPKSVALYHAKQSPHSAYRIIGIATISKYNLLGMERQEETLNQMMKNLAASVGGDALININSNKKSIQANVIAFQKILF